jgi:hypothetical protein
MREVLELSKLLAKRVHKQDSEPHEEAKFKFKCRSCHKEFEVSGKVIESLKDSTKNSTKHSRLLMCPHCGKMADYGLSDIIVTN